MNIDQKLLSSVAAEIQALDFSEENARIAELEVGIAQKRDALDRALARRQEITDALIAGVSPTKAAELNTTEEKLERERAALDAAVPDLRRRIQSSEDAIREVKDRSRKRIAPIVQPLVDAIDQQARDLSQELSRCWAATEVLGAATYSAFPVLRGLRHAVKSLHEDFSLLPRNGPVDVPAELVRILRPLESKGVALPAKPPQTSFTPY